MCRRYYRRNVSVGEYKVSGMREIKEWTLTIGQNGGREMKRIPEPAVVTKRIDESKGRKDKLTATIKNNVETENMLSYRIA